MGTEAESQGNGASRGGPRSWTRYLPLEPFQAFNREQLLSPGMALVAVVCLASILVWVAQGSESLRSALTVGAKASAFLAITLLSLNFVLSTRARPIERLFGGLDRMYKAHRYVGKLTLLFAILHPSFLVLARVGDWGTVASYLVPGLNLPFTLGLLSTLVLAFLIVLSVQAKLPYHLWHNTHRLMAVPLVLALAHALLSGSDIAAYPVLAYWVAGISALGLVCFLYTLALYHRLGPRHKAVVTTVRRLGRITELRFRPEGPFRFHPGQFVFVRFLRFPQVRESFPFSLSSDPSEGTLRISAKSAGDFTSQLLPHSQEGDQLEVMGPYGKFGERYLTHKNDMLWVAGGIGITPFLSMSKHESLHSEGRRVDLVWVFSDPSDAAYEAELLLEARNNPRFRFHHWNSRNKGRIDATALAGLIGGDQELMGRSVFICGPPPMMRSLFDQLVRRGVPSRRIVYEDFDLLG